MAHRSRQFGTCSAMSRFTGDGLKRNEDIVQSGPRSNEEVFTALVGKLHRSMVRMALRYVADRDIAEEVVQETWMAVITGIHRFERRSSLKTWIFSILVHKAKDRGVRESRHLSFSTFEASGNDIQEMMSPSCIPQIGEWTRHWAALSQPWNAHTPEKLLANRQAIHAMNMAIDGLPATLKAVLVLRDVEGVGVKDVCASLGITETNLYVRLHRARAHIRRVLTTLFCSPTCPV
ncbi:MAG: sigma-70 family RNA polymerase sigma factor [Nitrospira sp.]|nr:MAG: sigma-70 family RNA polymerase sigma factor [Nitrospira sp.]